MVIGKGFVAVPLHELVGVEIERLRQLPDSAEAGSVDAALDSVDRADRHPDPLGEFPLSQQSALAPLPQPPRLGGAVAGADLRRIALVDRQRLPIHPPPRLVSRAQRALRGRLPTPAYRSERSALKAPSTILWVGGPLDGIPELTAGNWADTVVIHHPILNLLLTYLLSFVFYPNLYNRVASNSTRLLRFRSGVRSVASVRILWDGDKGFDIHVLKGETSPSLLPLLVIWDDSVPSKGTFANAAALPADVDKITFTPNFLTVTTPPSNGGISVNTANGAVTVPSPLPAPPRLRSFVLEATVTTKPPNVRTLGPIPIRVCVHDSITDFWLTPNPLTLRQNAHGQQLTVLAEFDDRTVGDISRRPGITWASSDSGIVEFPSPASAQINAKLASATAVKVTATHAGISRRANVTVEQPWSTPVAVKLVAGSAGVAKMATSPNILFMPDGFTAAEKPKFEALVNSIVRQIQSNSALTPFNLLKGSINYFMTFVPSPQRGCSVLYDLDLRRRTTLFGGEIPDPVKPTPPTPFTVENLIWEVGLPTPADTAIGPTSARGDWLFQYGVGVSLGFSDPVYVDWQDLSDHRLANERNSALGFRNGQRPTMHNPDVARSVRFNDSRTTSAHLEDFFRNLRLKRNSGPMIGTIWAKQNAAGTVPAPSDPALPAGLRVGQDFGFIFILLGGARSGGTQLEEAIAGSLNDKEEIGLTEVAGSKQVNLVPFALPSTPSVGLIARVAHETSHAFGLDDEYGEFEAPLKIPATSEPGLTSQGNVMPASLVAKSAADPNLDPAKRDKIKWLWPRIDAAGVLDAEPVPNAFTFDIKLKPGHAAAFKPRPDQPPSIVRLRRRPLLDHPTPSGRMVVTQVSGNIVTVAPLPLTAITSADWPVGSILIRPLRGSAELSDPLGPDLPLVAPVILDHLGTSKLPLNLSPPAFGAPMPVCAKDTSEKQRPKNLPAAGLLRRGRPRFPSQIVGLYDGGSRYFCGVYHPSGVCLMRAKLVPGREAAIYLLCPVCRYVIVDRFDPTKHAAIDKEYAKRYPEP